MFDVLSTNRSFLYGDGFFETFTLLDGVCARFHLHYERIRHSFQILQMDWNEDWDQAYFEKKLKTEASNFETPLLKVRILFYRNSSGTYMPDANEANYYFKLEPYTAHSKSIIRAGIYPMATKPCNFLSSIKSTSCLMFVMAAKYAKEKGWDEVIILNEYGRVCEALSSNIFIKKDHVYITPPISEGCIDGVNRRAFIHEKPEGIIVERPIEVDELKEGHLFFSNAVRGMVDVELQS